MVKAKVDEFCSGYILSLHKFLFILQQTFFFFFGIGSPFQFNRENLTKYNLIVKYSSAVLSMLSRNKLIGLSHFLCGFSAFHFRFMLLSRFAQDFHDYMQVNTCE